MTAHFFAINRPLVLFGYGLTFFVMGLAIFLQSRRHSRLRLARPLRGTLASADSDIQPAQIAYLKSLGAIAGDWETGALAWVANKNAARLLILRGVSDLVNEKAGEAYDNLALFQDRTDEVMQNLFEQLPGWLQHIKL